MSDLLSAHATQLIGLAATLLIAVIGRLRGAQAWSWIKDRWMLEMTSMAQAAKIEDLELLVADLQKEVERLKASRPYWDSNTPSTTTRPTQRRKRSSP